MLIKVIDYFGVLRDLLWLMLLDSYCTLAVETISLSAEVRLPITAELCYVVLDLSLFEMQGVGAAVYFESGECSTSISISTFSLPMTWICFVSGMKMAS